jgi:hypothetical protein
MRSVLAIKRVHHFYLQIFFETFLAPIKIFIDLLSRCAQKRVKSSGKTSVIFCPILTKISTYQRICLPKLAKIRPRDSPACGARDWQGETDRRTSATFRVETV